MATSRSSPRRGPCLGTTKYLVGTSGSIGSRTPILRTQRLRASRAEHLNSTACNNIPLSMGATESLMVFFSGVGALAVSNTKQSWHGWPHTHKMGVFRGVSGVCFGRSEGYRL